METESNSEPQTVGSPTSRRNALKLGVAAGVGAVAWSGPTITSLGGTPAYALACTFARKFDLTGCRNTAQANCNNDGSTIAYQPFNLSAVNALAGYTITDGFSANQSFACNGSPTPTVSLRYPKGTTCEIAVYISETPRKCVEAGWTYPPFTTGLIPAGAAPKTISLNLPTKVQIPVTGANTFYQVFVNCVTTGQEACFA